MLALLLFAVACTPPRVFLDRDGDGFASNVDCDDGSAAVNPGRAERCDGIDEDCDGEVDEDPSDPGTWYPDEDGDGFGVTAAGATGCERPEGSVAEPGDCDDAAADVHPAAEEACDGRDEDCDGVVDGPESVDAGVWYPDADADGFGDGAGVRACDAPEGHAGTYPDCDDSRAEAYPGAPERCNARDDDCDGAIDELAVDATAWYPDADGDGHGAATPAVMSCATPPGHVWAADDCDDARAEVHPGAVDVCNGLDDDCDGVVDPLGDDWYRDADGDGWGAGAAVRSCDVVAGHVKKTGDCDDANKAVRPGAGEICNGVDDDCDGGVDVGAAGMKTWYADADADGYGDPSKTVTACSAPAGYVEGAGDCLDTKAAVHPGATEVCNGLDDDCDGTVDPGIRTWYADADKDGYGDPAQKQTSCTRPSGYVSAAGDCDDGEATVKPGATEVCNGSDDDCDGKVDVNAVDAKAWYPDVDGDGYGVTSKKSLACKAPTGYVAADEDCDDTKKAVNPGADEIWYDGVDQDCDGADDYDQDGDGVRAEAHGGFDCDDTDPAIKKCAPSVADGKNCLAIKTSKPSSGDGYYWIDTDGDSDATDAFEAWCEMTADGGGWTLLSWTKYSKEAPHGAPYPGVYVCETLDCDIGSAMSTSRSQELIRASKALLLMVGGPLTPYGPMSAYKYAGRYSYASLAGVTVAAGAVSSCSQLTTGTFKLLKGPTTAYDGLTVGLGRNLEAAWPRDYREGGDYGWSIGTLGGACTGSVDSPSSLMTSTGADKQFGPTGYGTTGQAVFVR